MKILLITGSFPPSRCGVGEYCYSLAEAIAKLPGIELGILTSANTTTPTDLKLSNVVLLKNIFGWRLRDTLQVLKLIKSFMPDVVHIQYPTNEYNGLLPRLLPIILKAIGLTVVQTWHEHYKSCGSIGWQNVIACDGLIYVRPDLPALLPNWVKCWLKSQFQAYIPNVATIPVTTLNENQIHLIRNRLSASKRIVCFFGFANENKGLENLFNIVNPETQHLVLICDLDIRNLYQEKILNIIKQEKWVNHVTVTGFLPSQEVGEILAASDAIIFPFPDGTGVWNTSLKAAENSGVFTIATTKQSELSGYQIDRNIYYCTCDDINSMGEVLDHYIGNRITPNTSYSWEDVSRSHYQLYQKLLNQHKK
ncbi:MAG: hypothetical protein CTY14_05890 [Methylotenera sp.]|nr:MAG: hypothetical protein CTY14_05890 [Methylotenera sp.]